MNSSAKARFTLLEVLLALTLVCLLSGAAFASLHISFRSRDSAERKLGRARMSEHFFTMIGRDLFNCPMPGGEMNPYFEGVDESDGDYGRDTVTLYTRPCRLRPLQPSGGIVKVLYELDATNPQAPVLLRRVIANVLAATEPEPVDEIVCRDVVGIAFSYYDGADWADSFDSQDQGDQLPLAVKCVLTVKDKKNGDEFEFARVFLLPCGTGREAESARLRR